MCSYRLTEDTFILEEEEYTGYGIYCLLENEIRVVKDISTDKELVADLISRLNKMDARGVHLDDIIEDFIS